MKIRRAMLPFAALSTGLYVVRGIAPTSSLALISPRGLSWFGCLAKFACLALGSVYGLAAARHFERDNPSRKPWLLLGLWLAAFAVGQAVLAFYELALRADPPLPSLGDPPFLLGYALMILAAMWFIRVYRASGFPIGSGAQHLAIATVAAAVFAILGVPLLRPIAAAQVSFGERAINLAYPILDFLALLPTLVLIRITLAFRGGKVWTVWVAILAGWVFMAAGDVLFAYLTSGGIAWLSPFAHLALLLGYLFAALGTMLQYALVTEK